MVSRPWPARRWVGRWRRQVRHRSARRPAHGRGRGPCDRGRGPRGRGRGPHGRGRRAAGRTVRATHPVLQVRHRRVLRMVRQPGIHDPLDHSAPAQRAADERAATLRGEVLGQPLVAGVALAAERDLGVDVGLGDLEALLVGDLREHEKRLGPPLGVRAELGVDVFAGLLDGLEVRLFADALARERGAELVVHDLDLLVDQHVGQLDGGVGHGVLDDPVREAVPGAVERVLLEPLADVAAHLFERLEPPDAGDEVLVQVRLDLLAKLLELDAEMRDLARERRLAVVLGERDVELGRFADLDADEVRFEPGDQALLADDQRHPLGRAALERLPVLGADERDDGVVAVLGAAVLDGCEGRVLVAQLLDDLVDPRVVDVIDLGREVEVAIVAERDLRADRDRRLEDERLALLGLDDLDVRVAQRQDRLLDDRLAVGVLHQVIDRLVEHDAGPEMALEDGSRRLAGAEAGHAGPPGERSYGVVQRALEALRGQLDLELDGRLGGWGTRDLHRREV